MLAAIRAAYDDLEGDYAFVITHRDEHRLYAVKKGSGLVTGLAIGFTGTAFPLVVGLMGLGCLGVAAHGSRALEAFSWLSLAPRALALARRRRGDRAGPRPPPPLP